MSKKLIVEFPTEEPGTYKMMAYFADTYGNTIAIEVGPSTELTVSDYFCPCGICGNAVLDSAFNGEEDCCEHCLALEKTSK